MSLRTLAENLKLRNELMAVKTCSKAISAPSRGHGKSPCFSQLTFLHLVGPDYPLSILPFVNVGEFLVCAL